MTAGGSGEDLVGGLGPGEWLAALVPITSTRQADELDQTMYITAMSRRGRRNESCQPSLSIVTMNPNDTHLKQLHCGPWRAGTLSPDTVVIEFTLDDSWQTPADIEAQKRNPRPWRERYLYNNWSYQDDIDSLFKYRSFDAAVTPDLDSNAPRYVGYDVARSGTDRSVAALWYGKTLADIQIVKASDEQMTTDDQALWLIKFLTQNAVLPDNTDVDGVGLGVGVIDFLKSRGLRVHEFISAAALTPTTSCGQRFPTTLPRGSRRARSRSMRDVRSATS